MWEKVKSKVVLILTALVGILYLLLRIQKDKKETAEAKLLNANYDKNDAVLKEKTEEAKAEAEKAKADGESEKAKKLSKKEMEEALKKL